jgi:hypothetical protein
MSNPTSTKSWRELLPVHPAAELFPRMSPDEMKALGEDIKANGLQSPIAFLKGKDGTPQVLDGCNRLDAMELVGFQFCPGEDGKAPAGLSFTRPDNRQAVYYLWHAKYSYFPEVNGDPYAFVISANIHRRHLTTEQRKEIAAALLRVNPARSDRSVAKEVRLDNKTVAPGEG